MIDTFGHIKLFKTCEACPEQYEVYNEGENIGYIRYRRGWLKANPIINGEYLFDENVVEEQIGDQYDGILPEDSREVLLKNCITKIVEYHNSL